MHWRPPTSTLFPYTTLFRSASDIVKIAMLHADEAFRREGLDAELLMQVHDELLVECPRNEAEKVAKTLKREMESAVEDRKSTRLNSSHVAISYAVFCLKKKK